MATVAGDHLAARIGTTLAGRYRILRLIGAGGMGAVYEAVHAWTERRVAAKVMLGDGAHRPDLVERFRREARAATRVGHPNIVQVLDMGQDPADGALFIVYEYLDGEDLAARIAREGAVPAREALELLVPVMGALVAAHRHGVVHRDLKPENIVLARQHGGGVQPKIIDFGVAKLIAARRDSTPLTAVGVVLGTLQFAAPEQLRGEPDVGPQVDVWAMAVVLYEALAGRLPFEAKEFGVLSAQILSGPIPRLARVAPFVPTPLCEVVHRGLARDRAQRFATMAAFLEALLDCPGLREQDWHRTLATTHRSTPDGAPPAWTVDDPFEDGETTLRAADRRAVGAPTARDRAPTARDAAARGAFAQVVDRRVWPPPDRVRLLASPPVRRRRTRAVVVTAALLCGAAAVLGVAVTHTARAHPREPATSARTTEPRAPQPAVVPATAPPVLVPLPGETRAPAAAAPMPPRVRHTARANPEPGDGRLNRAHGTVGRAGNLRFGTASPGALPTAPSTPARSPNGAPILEQP